MGKEQKERPQVVLVNRCMVYNDKGEILLIRRSEKDRNYPGLWEFPGGKLEEGQDVSHALEKEVLEETGLFVLPTSRVAYVESEPARFYEGIFIALIGIGKLIGGKLQLSEEHDAYKWVKPDEAYDLPLKPEVRKALAALTSSSSK